MFDVKAFVRFCGILIALLVVMKLKGEGFLIN